MPQIPTANQPVRKRARIPEGAMTAPGEAMARAGQSMMNLAQYSRNVFEKIQGAEDNATLLTFKNEVNRSLNDKYIELRKNNDYQSLDEFHQAAIQEILDTYQNKYGENGRLWGKAMEPYLNAQLEEFRVATAVRKMDLISKQAKTQLNENLLIAASKIAHEQDPATKESDQNVAELEIESARIEGNITADEANTAKLQFRTKIQETEISAAFGSDSVKEIEEMLKRTEANEFQLVDQQWLANASNSAQDRIVMLKKRYKAEEEAARFNQSTGNLESDPAARTPDGKFNFKFIEAQIGSESWRKSMGLIDENGNQRTEEIAKVMNYFSGLEAQQEDANNDEIEGNLDQVQKVFGEGNLSIALKLASDPKTNLGSSRIPLINAINTAIKSNLEGYDDKTSALEIATINEFLTRMWSGDIIKDMDGKMIPLDARYVERYILGSHLTKEDKEQYLGKVLTEKDEQVNKGLSRGFEYIKNVIAPELSTGQKIELTTDNPNALAEYFMRNSIQAKLDLIGKTQIELSLWVNGIKAQGKPISSDQIYAKAIQLASEKWDFYADQFRKNEQSE